MMKKGFTLIELLAVIVILAIIALIAIPLIGNVIEKAKIGALESSVNGLVESANMYYTYEIINGDVNEDVVFDFEEGIQTSDNKLSYKGKVYNGKLILTSDSDVITCIDDGKYYAYKEKDSDEVISGIGTCLYDGTTGDFTIESDVDVIIKECDEDKKELQEQITNLTTTVNNLQQTINEKEQAISDLTSIKEGLENQVTTLEGEKEDLLKQIENGNLSNSELNTRIAELEGTIDTLESSIEAKNNEITVLNGEKTELQTELTTKTNELKALNENLGKVTATASDVLSGKTILTSSGLVTGTMTSQKDQNTTDIATDSTNQRLNVYFPTGAWLQEHSSHSNNALVRIPFSNLASKISLSASKIASGQTIIGVTGTYTSDANATASQILKGKTAYVNGSKITGTMTNKAETTTAATTVTESGDNALITIPANGYYSTSSKISVPIETIKNEVSSLNTNYEISRVNTSSISAGSSRTNFLTLNCEGYTTLTFTPYGYANFNSSKFTISIIGSNSFNDSASYDWYGNPCSGTTITTMTFNSGQTYSIDISGYKYIYFNASNGNDAYAGAELRHVTLS